MVFWVELLQTIQNNANKPYNQTHVAFYTVPKVL